MTEDKDLKGWQTRHTFVFLSFVGFTLFYSLRFNLSIAIVAMVNREPVSSKDGKLFNASESICPALVNSTNNNASLGAVQSDGASTTFDWNEVEQGVILGSFFWGYILTQLPGGLLAQKYGAKIVIGLGMLGAGMLSIVLPGAAVLGGRNLVIFVRVLQGISEGVVFPAFVYLLSKWTSPKERAGIATLCCSGMPFGTAMTMLVSGHLITNFGWPAVFYVPGTVTIIWFLLWSFLVYSSPQDHPRISDEEKDFIVSSIGSEEGEKPTLSDVPWRAILSSVPFWAIFLAHFSNVYGLNTLNQEGPKYLHSVLHFEIEDNAYIAATPHITQWIFCIGVTKLSDFLIRTDKLSVGAARKLCNTIGMWGNTFAYLGVILAGCNRTLAVFFFMLAGLFNGAVFGGMIVSPVDISPNYAGALEGLINGVSNVAGIGAPYVAGLILHNMPSLAGWQYVFVLPMIVNFLGNVIFLIFSSAEVQPWNHKQSGSRI